MRNRQPLVPLGDLLKAVCRAEAVLPARDYALLGAHWYAKGLYTKEVKAASAIRATKLYRVEDGDFVYNRLFGWKGSFAIATVENAGCYVSNEFPCFYIVTERVVPWYLQWYFSREAAWNEALGLSYGATPTSRNRLKEENLLSMRIPLPPLSEQRRIVAKIEQLAAKIDEARDLKSQADSESTSLERSSIDQAYHESVRKHGRVRLETLCEVITDGDHLTPRFVESGVRFIFVGNVSSGHLHFNGCKRVSREYFAGLKATRKPKPGDVLYSAVGATLGVPVVVDSADEFCFQRHIAIIKLKHDQLLPAYLWYMLRSRTLYGIAWESTTGSAQPTIPLRGIKAMPMSAPPLDEQRRTVAYLDGLQVKVDRLKALQEKTAAELDALLPAILDQAFKGEL